MSVASMTPNGVAPVSPFSSSESHTGVVAGEEFLRKTLAQMRSFHELELARAAEREAALSVQLSAAQAEARDGASREMDDLASRAQVADWRIRQSQRQVEAAEVECARVAKEMHAAQANIETLHGELESVRHAREAALARAAALTLRESELMRTIQTERDERRAEVDRVSEAGKQAVDAVKAETMAVRRERDKALDDLDCEREASASAQAAAEALTNDAAIAAQRVLQAESTLAAERKKLSADRRELESQIKLGREAVSLRESSIDATLAHQAAASAQQLAALRESADAEREAQALLLANAMAAAKAELAEAMLKAQEELAESVASAQSQQEANRAHLAIVHGEAQVVQQVLTASLSFDEANAHAQRRAHELALTASRTVTTTTRQVLAAALSSAEAESQSQQEAASTSHAALQAEGEAEREAHLALLSRAKAEADALLAAARDEAQAGLVSARAEKQSALAAAEAEALVKEQMHATALREAVADARATCSLKTLNAVAESAAAATRRRALRGALRLLHDRCIATHLTSQVLQSKLCEAVRESSAKRLRHALCSMRTVSWLVSLDRRRLVMAQSFAARTARKAFASWRGLHRKLRQHRRGSCLSMRRRQACAFHELRRAAEHGIMVCRAAAILHRIQMRRAVALWVAPPPLELGLHVRSLMHHAAMSTRRAGVRRALNSWMSWARARSSACQRIENTLRELRGQGIRHGWYSWVEHLQQRSHLRHLVALICRQKEACSWRTWLELCQMRKEKCRVLRWVAGSLASLRTRMAFNAWAVPAVDELKLYLRSVLHRTATAMRHRKVLAALNTWMAQTRALLDARRRVTGVVRELLGRGVRRGWFKWLEVLEHTARLRRYMAALCMRVERAALRSWVVWQDQLQYMNHVLACLRPSGRQLRRALNTWWEVRLGALEVRRATLTMMRLTERRAFNSWLAHASSQAREQAKMGLRLTISHLLNRQLSCAWNHWVANFEWPAIAMKLVLAFDSGKLREAFGFWRTRTVVGRGDRIVIKKLQDVMRTAAAERTAFATELQLVEGASAEASERLLAEMTQMQLEATEANEHAASVLLEAQALAVTEKEKAVAAKQQAADAAEHTRLAMMSKEAADLAREEAAQKTSAAALSNQTEAVTARLALDEAAEGLQNLELTTSSAFARLDREAALATSLKEEVARLQEEVLAADATGGGFAIKLAAAERDLARLRAELLEAKQVPEPPPQPAPPLAPPPPPQPPSEPPAPLTRSIALSPPPFRLPAPPEVRPPTGASPPSAPASRSPPTAWVRPAMPPSDPTKLLRQTVSSESKQWAHQSNARRAAAVKAAQEAAPWKPAGYSHDLDPSPNERLHEDSASPAAGRWAVLNTAMVLRRSRYGTKTTSFAEASHQMLHRSRSGPLLMDVAHPLITRSLQAFGARSVSVGSLEAAQAREAEAAARLRTAEQEHSAASAELHHAASAETTGEPWERPSTM